MEVLALAKVFAFLRQTPFHPQWLIFLGESRRLKHLVSQLSGTVLDLGCGSGCIRSILPPQCQYIGLDYLQTAVMYGSKPDVFGDAQAVPFADACADWVLLLDVLEHLPRPDDCLQGVHRVLRTGGKLIIKVPFIYPVHDAPLDFQRWTAHGLRELARRHGYKVTNEFARGAPIETAVLLTNIALVKTTLNWLKQGKLILPALFLAILALLAVPSFNLMAFVLARFGFRDRFMAHELGLILEKT